jgi:hypothetical protein
VFWGGRLAWVGGSHVNYVISYLLDKYFLEYKRAQDTKDKTRGNIPSFLLVDRLITASSTLITLNYTTRNPTSISFIARLYYIILDNNRGKRTIYSLYYKVYLYHTT